MSVGDRSGQGDNVRRIVIVLGGVVVAGLIVAAVGLFYLAYRRVEVPIRLSGSSITVAGVVTEMLVEERPDRLVPFPIRTYLVRYAFPTTKGQMHTGEQVVTRAFYSRIAAPGAPIWVTFGATDPGLNAVDPSLSFPAAAGWRLGMGLAALLAAAAVVNVGLFLLKRSAP